MFDYFFGFTDEVRTISFHVADIPPAMFVTSLQHDGPSVSGSSFAVGGTADDGTDNGGIYL